MKFVVSFLDNKDYSQELVNNGRRESMVGIVIAFAIGINLGVLLMALLIAGKHEDQLNDRIK
jgi:hypothetical protein